MVTGLGYDTYESGRRSWTREGGGRERVSEKRTGKDKQKRSRNKPPAYQHRHSNAMQNRLCLVSGRDRKQEQDREREHSCLVARTLDVPVIIPTRAFALEVPAISSTAAEPAAWRTIPTRTSARGATEAPRSTAKPSRRTSAVVVGTMVGWAAKSSSSLIPDAAAAATPARTQ